MATEDVTRDKGGGQPAEEVETGRRIHRRYKKTFVQRSLRKVDTSQQGPLVAYEGNEVVEEINVEEFIEERPPTTPPAQSSPLNPRLRTVLLLVFVVLLLSKTDLGAKVIDSLFGSLDVIEFARKFLRL